MVFWVAFFLDPFPNRRKINSLDFVNWHARLVVSSFMQKLRVVVHRQGLKKHHKIHIYIYTVFFFCELLAQYGLACKTNLSVLPRIYS